MKRLLMIVSLGLLLGESVDALTRFQTISHPAACPESLLIDVSGRPNDEDLHKIKIRYRPHEPEIYRGRQRAYAVLELRDDTSLLARLNLKVTRDNEGFHSSFQLKHEKFKKATLKLSTQLYEKDGFPTVGGGEILEVDLTRFAPQTSEKELGQSAPAAAPASSVDGR